MRIVLWILHPQRVAEQDESRFRSRCQNPDERPNEAGGGRYEPAVPDANPVLSSEGNAGGNHSALDLAAGRPTHTKDALELLEAVPSGWHEARLCRLVRIPPPSREVCCGASD